MIKLIWELACSTIGVIVPIIFFIMGLLLMIAYEPDSLHYTNGLLYILIAVTMWER